MRLVPTAFGLEEITPTAEGVVLDYLSHEGKPVRIAVHLFARRQDPAHRLRARGAGYRVRRLPALRIRPTDR